jgi:hypothetical protein
VCHFDILRPDGLLRSRLIAIILTALQGRASKSGFRVHSWRNIAITLIDAGVQSAHGLLETNFGRTLRFRNHLSLLSHLDSYEGHISRSGTRNNWFDRRGRRRDLCFAFTCLLGTGDNRVWRGILPVSGGLKDQLGGRETPNNFCRTIVVSETSPLHSLTLREQCSQFGLSGASRS